MYNNDQHRSFNFYLSKGICFAFFLNFFMLPNANKIFGMNEEDLTSLIQVVQLARVEEIQTTEAPASGVDSCLLLDNLLKEAPFLKAIKLLVNQMLFLINQLDLHYTNVQEGMMEIEASIANIAINESDIFKLDLLIDANQMNSLLSQEDLLKAFKLLRNRISFLVRQLKIQMVKVRLNEVQNLRTQTVVQVPSKNEATMSNVDN